MNELAQKPANAELVKEMADAFGPDHSKTIVILLSILDGMTGFAFNGDMWHLAYYAGKGKCEAMGITPEEFEAVRAKFNELRVARKRRSPMACLHEAE